MSSTCYFWKDGEVVTLDSCHASRVNEADLISHLCVDTTQRGEDMRYGEWRDTDVGWVHVPFDQFPAEFKMNLLLLGVT